MANKAENIASHVFKKSDRVLLDANVWLFINGPQNPGDRRVSIYSEAFKKILQAGSAIYVDALIVSEFINRYARMKYELWKTRRPQQNTFKNFRKSADFKPAAREISDSAKYVLRNCARIDSGFASLDIDSLLKEYADGDSDFNDQVLSKLCKREGLIFITDDADFKKHDLPILSANKKLLK